MASRDFHQIVFTVAAIRTRIKHKSAPTPTRERVEGPGSAVGSCTWRHRVCCTNETGEGGGKAGDAAPDTELTFSRLVVPPFPLLLSVPTPWAKQAGESGRCEGGRRPPPGACASGGQVGRHLGGARTWAGRAPGRAAAGAAQQAAADGPRRRGLAQDGQTEEGAERAGHRGPGRPGRGE